MDADDLLHGQPRMICNVLDIRPVLTTVAYRDLIDLFLRLIRLDLDLRLDLFRFQTFDVCLECFFFHSFGPLCLVTDKYTAFPCVSHTPPLCDFSISTDFSDASGHRKRS